MTESNVPVVLCKLAIQVMSRLAYVQRRAKRAGNAMDDVARSESEGVIDRIAMVTGACEDGGFGKVGVSVVEVSGWKQGNESGWEVGLGKKLGSRGSRKLWARLTEGRRRLVKMCEVTASNWSHQGQVGRVVGEGKR